MCSVELIPFSTFAKEIGGLTNREAHAMFFKMDFWEVCAGLTQFPDGG
jgi:hypothetical protein